VTTFSIATMKFRMGLSNVSLALAGSDDIPALQCIKLSWSQEATFLRLEATDRYRLFRHDIPMVNREITEDGSFLLAGDTARNWLKTLPKQDACTFTLNDSVLEVEIPDGTLLRTGSVVADFPKVGHFLTDFVPASDGVIPTQFGFNPVYLASYSKLVDDRGRRVKEALEFTTPKSGATLRGYRIRSTNAGLEGFDSILMPVRLDK